MSWSVSAVGKSEAVRKDIAGQFIRGGKCVEPEESIRQKAAEMIDGALAAISSIYAVKVMASGSQGFKDYSKPENGVCNSLNISVEVLHGFVE